MTLGDKIITFKGTQKQIEKVLSILNLSLLDINEIHFMKKALRSNLNNLQFDENIYLNRLKEQYKTFKNWEKDEQGARLSKCEYNAMRLFCLDTQLISFNDIELMEYEVNQGFY